ncbi:histidinol phosphate aminotransferase [Methanobrevibacter arboriphilus JCM 13429 = DSM 1125]|uniref:Histidinol-phosphate aminotransferase n=1 Tax=Methanobrevibacter arboriphilus JCM 13429 = DSM 1125 TaxID=1300164 RepID=A0A1V6N4Z2_METAZ|nr:histidinol-phosphate transaminase [Methanobrevibacter arboriphilus]OQD59729.1 histidinol phosphate aminotransferase [Methanobrevibacter arboriphilus JCM 13429 = DSM 1125]
MRVRKIVNELDPYIPGRSQDEIAEEFGLKKEDIIKLGSNENPWGPSKKAISSIENELSSINRYPESDLSDLKKEIASYSGVNSSQVIVGGDGADEIIDILAKTFIEEGDEFIVPLPSYMYYEFLFKPYGAIPVYGKWNLEDNTLDLDSIISKINEKTKMIFLCSPNNPTGALVSREDIINILEITEEKEIVLVIDEAYFEYSEVNNVDLINNNSNVFIMRTMSKVFGLAGMRVGYGLANSEMIEYMHRIKPVFSLTKLSYFAALNTLKDKEYIEKSIKKGIESREFLFEELSKINSLNVLQSCSNYILIGIKEIGITAKDLSQKLMEKGVIVRDCTSFKGLDEYWIRVSIGTIEEDKKFLEIFNRIISDI